MLHPATARVLRDLRDQAEALDAADPLAEFRAAFLHPRAPSGGEAIYLCGNSRKSRLLPRNCVGRWNFRCFNNYVDSWNNCYRN